MPVLKRLSQYRSAHISRFGDYMLDLLRVVDPIDYPFGRSPGPALTSEISARLAGRGCAEDADRNQHEATSGHGNQRKGPDSGAAFFAFPIPPDGQGEHIRDDKTDHVGQQFHRFKDDIMLPLYSLNSPSAWRSS